MKPIKITMCAVATYLLVFNAQAQYGLQNFNNWAQDLVNTGTIQVTNNVEAICSVDYTGTNFTDRPRAELANHNLVPTGATVTFKFDVYIENPAGGTEAGGCIFQLFAQGDDGSYQAPNLLLRTAGGGTFEAANSAPFGGTNGQKTLSYSAPCLTNWYTFVVQIYCKNDNSGFINVWAGNQGSTMNYVGTIYGNNTLATNKGCIVKCGTYSMGAPQYSVGKVTIENMTATLAGTFTNIYEALNVESGLGLNVSGAALTNSAPIIQWPFVAGSKNAEWTFTATTNGYYHLANVNSGLDATVQGSSTNNGANIIQYSTYAGDNGQWKPVYNNDGTYSFYNRNSGKVLEDPGFSKSRGTQMDQWSFDNTAISQRWILISQ